MDVQYFQQLWWWWAFSLIPGEAREQTRDLLHAKQTHIPSLLQQYNAHHS